MITLTAVEQLVSYHLGSLPMRKPLDCFVIEHLDTMKEMGRFTAQQQQIMRLAAMGYTQGEIASLLGFSLRTTVRRIHELRILIAQPEAA